MQSVLYTEYHKLFWLQKWSIPLFMYGAHVTENMSCVSTLADAKCSSVVIVDALCSSSA